MATFILKWNPAISSYRMIDYLRDLDTLLCGGSVDMNWSVWDYDKIRKGDTVYMLKVGYGATGIVMKGRVTSKAWQGQDWSGKGRQTYYVNFGALSMLSPDCAPILDSATLIEAIPDFDWRGGHSGMMLADGQAEVLEKEWNTFMHANFGARPKSKAPMLYVKSRAKTPKFACPADERAIRLGEALFQILKERRPYPHRSMPQRSMLEVAQWLLRDAPDSWAYADVNLECARRSLWTDYMLPTYLANAVNGYRALKESGRKLTVDLDELEQALARREKYGEELRLAEDLAEHGELQENLRDLIEGFDLINGKMGSFHDSELLEAIIDHDADSIELKFHMCNGADEILVLRFEGRIEYSVSGDGNCVCLYLDGGYFHSERNRVYLDIDGFGEISAESARVISFIPAPDDEE